MWHATCTQGSQGDSIFLMVGSQTTNLTLGPSFGHNLCFKCLNGSCDPILNISISKAFQWYKELFKTMSFFPCNCLLKIWESKSQSGKVLGNLGVHSLTLSYTPESMKCDSQTSFLARTFANPCLGREPRAKVATQPFFLGIIQIIF